MTKENTSSPFVLDFGSAERFAVNASPYTGTYDTNGGYEFVKTDDGTACMRLVYSPTDPSMNDYRILLSLAENAAFSEKKRYLRLTYMTGSAAVMTVTLRDNCRHQSAIMVKNTAPYAGEWHCSEPIDIAGSGFMDRFLNGKYNGIQFDGADENADIYIKELAFFESLGDAYAYSGEVAPTVTPFNEGDRCTVTVGGTDISEFRAVIDRGLSDTAVYGLNRVIGQIKRLTGFTLPVVYADSTESEYEILVGRSERTLSEYGIGRGDGRQYAVSRVGHKLIITASDGFGVRSALDRFLGVCLCGELVNVPDKIETDDNCGFTGCSDLIAPRPPRTLPENVETPQVIAEDFENGCAYLGRDTAYESFSCRDGFLSADSAGRSIAYLHVYETNAEVTAGFTVGRAGKNGSVGLMLRCVSGEGYIGAGYDLRLGEWYIDSREGNDFYRYRLASVKAELVPDRRYALTFRADGHAAELRVDGEPMLSADGLSHITAGRIAVFAEDAAVSVDSLRAVLMSGEGRVLRRVTHSLIPDGVGNGASFFELADGSVHAHVPMFGSVGLVSDDGGETWQRTDAAIGEKGKYANVLRLSDGDYLGIFISESDGDRRIVSRLSHDEGRSWTDRAEVCAGYFGDTGAVAGNMNDKLTESPRTGRVFYVQNYQTKAGVFVEGRHVFCEVYYTDDKGASWHKSLTDSWQIEGNETESRFGECKILECADGTLRMYCSWSEHGCIVYSESHDNGLTWGALCRMEEFVTPRSSMQFCRDPYGETDTTYYMVWINNKMGENTTMPRHRLSLARTLDGKTWEFLGDIWRWDSAYLHHASKSDLNQIVNPTVAVCRDSIIVGSGISEKLAAVRFNYHGFQQQHIWAIKRENCKTR